MPHERETFSLQVEETARRAAVTSGKMPEWLLKTVC
jgi:hypothetical protein